MKQIEMENLSACLICKSTNSIEFRTCTDYTTSKQKFKIVKCQVCGFAYTNPRPKAENAGQYYESNDYISHNDAAKGIFSTIYKLVRSVTLRSKVNLVKKTTGKQIGTIVDYGCGTGEFLKKMIDSGWNGIGVEPSAIARKQISEKLNTTVLNPEELEKIEDNTLDAITMFHVLEHVYNPHYVLRCFSNKLKSDGMLLIAVPNREAKEEKIYKEYWAAYDVPRHIWHFRYSDIEQLCIQNNFIIVQYRPMIFDPFYISMLSEKYKGSKSYFIKGAWTGLLSMISSLKNKKYSSSLLYILRKHNTQNKAV
ncbi:MAG TPA: class I SAM-dependent methyltransferase [Bacteroidia bacterium]|nr:class I SAM-dependent methyltransferase [Bacteroidia bacterium]